MDICVKITTLLLHREEFNIPTPEEELEYLKEYLARPDAVARMEQWAPVFDALAGALRVFDKQIQALVKYVAALPPSPGYEPYLVERSVDPILARAMSRTCWSSSTALSRC